MRGRGAEGGCGLPAGSAAPGMARGSSSACSGLTPGHAEARLGLNALLAQICGVPSAKMLLPRFCGALSEKPSAAGSGHGGRGRAESCA